MCQHSGCYCKAYVVPTSKWSKGKCKSCNHHEREHGEHLEANVSFDSNATAAPPTQSTQYNAQIDSKMGIAPSGNTDFKSFGAAPPKQPQAPSIYTIHLNESDWINWSADDVLVW